MRVRLVKAHGEEERRGALADLCELGDRAAGGEVVRGVLLRQAARRRPVVRAVRGRDAETLPVSETAQARARLEKSCDRSYSCETKPEPVFLTHLPEAPSIAGLCSRCFKLLQET